ncbi:helix-turn-helix domain-containing protein [Streptomyces sp. NPDC002181]|uniref:helix-turn-helix domain-containing protein n=1 Tax=unclassified Streptomyces TaxID=2593676 RepID=UPI00364F93DC
MRRRSGHATSAGGGSALQRLERQPARSLTCTEIAEESRVSVRSVQRWRRAWANAPA